MFVIAASLLVLNAISMAVVFGILPLPTFYIYPTETNLNWMDIINLFIQMLETWEKGSTEGVESYLPENLPVGNVVYSFYPWGMKKYDRDLGKELLYKDDGHRIMPVLVRDVLSQFPQAKKTDSVHTWERVAQNTINLTKRSIRNISHFDRAKYSEMDRENAQRLLRIQYCTTDTAARHKQFLYYHYAIAFLGYFLSFFIQSGGWQAVLWIAHNITAIIVFFGIHDDMEGYYTILQNNDIACTYGPFFWLHFVLMFWGWIGLYISFFLLSVAE